MFQTRSVSSYLRKLRPFAGICRCGSAQGNRRGPRRKRDQSQVRQCDATGGAQLENLVGCTLLEYAQFRKDACSENWNVFYLRDKEGREVDFVVTHNRMISSSSYCVVITRRPARNSACCTVMRCRSIPFRNAVASSMCGCIAIMSPGCLGDGFHGVGRGRRYVSSGLVRRR